MTSFFFAATATSATRTENRTKSAEIYLTTVLAIFSNQAAITSSSRKRENEKKFCRRRRRRRCRCYCDKPASKSITTATAAIKIIASVITATSATRYNNNKVVKVDKAGRIINCSKSERAYYNNNSWSFNNTNNNSSCSCSNNFVLINKSKLTNHWNNNIIGAGNKACKIGY